MTQASDIPYAIGDAVIVTALNAKGTVVERLSNNSYRVALRSMYLTVRHAELKPTATGNPSRPSTSDSYKAALKAAPTGATVKGSIDLHGLTVDEACRSLEAWLNAAIVSHTKHGKVIHGLGTGRVQQAAHEVLRRYSAVRAFRINDVNPGETDVYFEVG
jgi:DNA mismatch repair protein MutS2